MSDKSEIILVSETDQFIELLIGWHQGKVRTLEHMLTIPEGVEVSFNGEDSQILSGDLHKGFLMGLSLGLMELGSLPFAAEPVHEEEDEDDDEEQPAASDEPVKH